MIFFVFCLFFRLTDINSSAEKNNESNENTETKLQLTEPT